MRFFANIIKLLPDWLWQFMEQFGVGLGKIGGLVRGVITGLPGQAGLVSPLSAEEYAASKGGTSGLPPLSTVINENVTVNVDAQVSSKVDIDYLADVVGDSVAHKLSGRAR